MFQNKRTNEFICSFVFLYPVHSYFLLSCNCLHEDTSNLFENEERPLYLNRKNLQTKY